MLLLPPPALPSRPIHLLLFSAALSLSIHLPSPFPILSVSSTREGRIADVFTIVVSLDRKVRHGCRYRACALSLSPFFVNPLPFLPSPGHSPFFSSILSRSFLIVARRENLKPRSNSSILDIRHDCFFNRAYLHFYYISLHFNTKSYPLSRTCKVSCFIL